VYLIVGEGIPVAVAMNEREAEHNPESFFAVGSAGQVITGGS
jgi:hypothetical protein